MSSALSTSCLQGQEVAGLAGISLPRLTVELRRAPMRRTRQPVPRPSPSRTTPRGHRSLGGGAMSERRLCGVVAGLRSSTCARTPATSTRPTRSARIAPGNRDRLPTQPKPQGMAPVPVSAASPLAQMTAEQMQARLDALAREFDRAGSTTAMRQEGRALAKVLGLPRPRWLPRDDLGRQAPVRGHSTARVAAGPGCRSCADHGDGGRRNPP
jgi:hypothetical protein